MLFSELGIPQDTAEALTEHGFHRPTPVQTEVIPRILEGDDVVAMAQTGSGKLQLSCCLSSSSGTSVLVRKAQA